MDAKCLTPIEEKRETPVAVVGSGEGGEKKYTASEPDPTDECSSSSSDDEQEEESYQDDRFHQGQDAYYRSTAGVTKVKVIEKLSASKYFVSLQDGTKKQVDGCDLVGLIDLTSKELAGLMKEKNERREGQNNRRNVSKEESSSDESRGEEGEGEKFEVELGQPLSSSRSRRESHGASHRSSTQSKGSLPTLDQGYEPENEHTSSDNSYENNDLSKEILALPCAVEMVEAKTEDGGTKIVPIYKADMDVYYRGPQGITVARILKTHLDDLLDPYYTIRLEDGREKQTDNAHISLEMPVEEEKEQGPVDPKQEDGDDWYQAWKEEHVKEEDEWRQKQAEAEQLHQEAEQQQQQETIKKEPTEYTGDAVIKKEPTESKESHSKENSLEKSSEKVAKPTSREADTLSPEPPFTTTKEPIPDPDLGALVPKRRGSDAVLETLQVKKQDPDETASIVALPQFHVGDDVLYNSSKGDHLRAVVMKIRNDNKNRPYYVIKLSNGEKKVYGHRLTPVRRDEGSADRRRSRSRSVSRRDPVEQISKRSASMGVRRMSRRPSIDSRASRDESVGSRSSHKRSASDIPRVDRSRSSSRPPSELDRSISRRGESRDPRGRVHPSDAKDSRGHSSRSRSMSVRAGSRDPRDERNKDLGERRQRERSRSRAPGESSSSTRRPTERRKGGIMGVSHRVQQIGDEEGSTARSQARSSLSNSHTRSSSRFSKMKSSLTSGIAKAKQRSFERG